MRLFPMIVLCGGVAFAGPFPGQIQARNLTALRAEVSHHPVPGLALGNSIMEGGWVNFLTKDIPNLQVANFGVGGAKVSQIGLVISPIWSKSNAHLTQPNPVLKGQKFALLGGLRNETWLWTSPLQVEAIQRVYGGIIDELLSQGIEPIMLSDQPQLDMTTGEVNPIATKADTKLVQLQSDLARQKGITFVNVWGQMMAMKKNGRDLRPLYLDGIHPADPGRQLIAQMVKAALFSEPVQNVARGAAGTKRLAILYPQGSSWASPKTRLTSPVSTQAARGRTEVFFLNPGQTVDFSLPGNADVWTSIVLQPQCTDSVVQWTMAQGLSFEQGACSQNAEAHREEVDYLGPDLKGTVTARNRGPVPVEVIGLLLALPR